MEYAKTHEEWNRALEKIAYSWQIKYGIDHEEAYSELLVAYAQALACPKKNENVAFDTIFTYYKKAAMKNLLRFKDRDRDYHTYMDVDVMSECFTSSHAEQALKEIIFEMDCVTLSDDALEVLNYILSDEWEQKGHAANMKMKTVIKDMHEDRGWAYSRARNAVGALKNFYMEFVSA